jgi:hypothetical protein
MHRSRATELLLHQRHHCSDPAVKEKVATLPNAITCFRGLVVASLLALAATRSSRELLILGLIVSWAGDLVDGYVARHWKRETVLGAQLDYNVDRLVATGAVVAVAVIDRGSAISVVAATIVWLQYGVFDQILCAQFLRFGLWTPDEFWLRDRTTWTLNWSPIAKLAGHVPLFLLVIGGFLVVPSAVVAVLLVSTRAAFYLVKNAALADTPDAPNLDSRPDTPHVRIDENSHAELATSASVTS